MGNVFIFADNICGLLEIEENVKSYVNVINKQIKTLFQLGMSPVTLTFRSETQSLWHDF